MMFRKIRYLLLYSLSIIKFFYTKILHLNPFQAHCILVLLAQKKNWQAKVSLPNVSSPQRFIPLDNISIRNSVPPKVTTCSFIKKRGADRIYVTPRTMSIPLLPRVSYYLYKPRIRPTEAR